MLKQAVYIKILTTTQTPDGQKDSMELDTQGHLTLEEKEVRLRYDVYEDGIKKTSTVHYDGNKTVTLHSDSQMQYYLKLQKDDTTTNRIYSFGYEMLLHVFTTHLSFEFNKQSGFILLQYDLISNDQILTTNQIRIETAVKD